MHVAIIGAGGRVGQELARQLADRGHTSIGIHRNPNDEKRIAVAGGTPAHFDLIGGSVVELAELLVGADAVVFAAGAHGIGAEFTTKIDGDGLRKTVYAAAEACVRRAVVLSAFPESARTAGLGSGYEHYLRVKKRAEYDLTMSDRDWLILRPGHMTDGPPTGKICAGVALPDEGDVNRADVVGFLITALESPTIGRAIVELTDGDTPIIEAVEAASGWSSPRPAY